MSYQISVIIPTYRNPDYLDLCLKSLVPSMETGEVQVVVVVDGFPEESRDVLNSYDKYEHLGVLELEENQGMASAINFGVYNAEGGVLLIVNDDNVFPEGWWDAIKSGWNYLSTTVISINQIEPEPSIYNFPTVNCGMGPKGFNWDKFNDAVKQYSKDMLTFDGQIFPILMRKNHFMQVGGFDTFYKSPFFVDFDFWLKLELCGLEFGRTHVTHLYHFGSRATKRGKEGAAFRASELNAATQFQYKWNFIPDIIANRAKGNSKFPSTYMVRGVTFNK